MRVYLPMIHLGLHLVHLDSDFINESLRRGDIRLGRRQPEDCQTEGCKIMLTFWELAGKEMPGLVWLVDCNETNTQVMSLGSNSVHRPSLAHRALRLARLALCLAVRAR